ncbi:thiamine pyrophosphate-binding protein [Geobacillus icigianus]|uniref:Thiamine pyrophosphate protein n=1 Tax=Geobacillus subterraneus TaxID=129338 RepID=A0A679FPS7_9BACL|nr:thiamine pyrophosphate-binding protein [Geobacillus subterraneus]BBW98498.1 thiamine pyrophosphate protein [Geobacillus subterraneus]
MKRTIRNVTVAKVIVECLKQEQIRHVFGVPGESYLPLLDAIYEEPSIEFISARHEGGASFMAEGYAKAARTCGVVLATRAVGAANLAIGVHTARQDSTPMVVFLGQVDSRFLGREGFQEVDLEAFFRPLAKWTVEIREAERVPELVQRAFRTAKTGRPGPVVVSLPEDVLWQTVPEAVMASTQVPKPAPRHEDVREVEAWLTRAKRPLVIAGGGVKWAGAEPLLRLWAETYSLPVMAAFRRHDVFPHDHPCYVGHLGLGAPEAVRETAEQADVVIALGTRLSEVTTQDYCVPSADQTLIHIDLDSDGFGKVRAPDVAIWADCREALSRLLTIAVRPSWQEWVAKRREQYEQTATLPEKPRNVYEAAMASFARHLPNNAVFTNDAGNFAGWLHTFFPFGEGHTYIGPTSGAMGYGMPAAIGAKLALPDRTVVSLSGDGGFMMTMQELETAVRYDIPIISVVFNNRMYGTIRMHQELRFPGRVIGTELGSVPFARLAECLNGLGFQVQTEQQFTEALCAALAAKRPTVIEVLADPDCLSVSTTMQELRARQSL